jgi:hypothetical protein
MGTEQAVQIYGNLSDSPNSPIPCQGIGGIRAEGEEGVRGGVRLRGLCPWSGEGPRRVGRAFRLAWPAERGGEAPPRSGEKAFPSGSICTTKGKTNPSRNLGKHGGPGRPPRTSRESPNPATEPEEGRTGLRTGRSPNPRHHPARDGGHARLSKIGSGEVFRLSPGAKRRGKGRPPDGAAGLEDEAGEPEPYRPRTRRAASRNRSLPSGVWTETRRLWG